MTSSQTAVETDAEFGTLLLCQRMGSTVLLCGVGVLLIGLVLTFGPSEPEVKSAGAPGLALAGALATLAGIHRRRRVVRIYKFGIVDRSKRMAYKDATEFTASVRFTIVNGIPAGTECRFLITGSGSTGPVSIAFSMGNLGNNSGKADLVISAISPAIQQKMLASIQEGKAVKWGKRGSIRQDCLEFSGKAPLSLKSIRRFELLNGKLYIATTDKRKAKISTDEVNFFPGFAIVAPMLSSQTENVG